MLQLLLAAAVGLSLPPKGAADGVLVAGDCSKCHFGLVQAYTAEGAGHADQLTCIDCHRNHPPKSGEYSPPCTRCHPPADLPHFALEPCSRCHRPHAPKAVDIAELENSRLVCVSCHSDVSRGMDTYPSRHAGMECVACHRRHKEVIRCLECHENHTGDLESPSCRSCHPPHTPTLVRYGDDVPSGLCAHCHRGQAEGLQKTTLRHGEFECIFCHRSQHRSKPICQTCHGQPHPKKMIDKFKTCNICHYDAHYLK